MKNKTILFLLIASFVILASLTLQLKQKNIKYVSQIGAYKKEIKGYKNSISSHSSTSSTKDLPVADDTVKDIMTIYLNNIYNQNSKERYEQIKGIVTENIIEKYKLQPKENDPIVSPSAISITNLKVYKDVDNKQSEKSQIYTVFYNLNQDITDTTIQSNQLMKIELIKAENSYKINDILLHVGYTLPNEEK